ncbi:MAG: basic amino acid/polyamine antiporter [Clostridium sp.]|uniref:basic amino acid/polyamine antiporter n=1 Tax=Clostridium sp. TaxID=1506 RepID=UPI003F40D41F
MEHTDKKLGFFGLAFLIIGAMLGGGLFSLPSQLAQNAGTFAIILGWIIAGIGVFGLAFVYQMLSNKKPHLTGGLFSYAQEGFGSYMGFNSAWIYWLSSIFGDVAYATLIFGSLSYFFNIFNPDGNNWPSIIGGSIIIWAINFLVLKGVKQAVLVNIIVTISKILPIILFIVVCIIFFNIKNFSFQFFGTPSLGGVFTQVKSTMIATLWSFVGIEGAVVVSGRAKTQKDVGRATIVGLSSAIFIYILISLIALGVMKRPEIASLQNPSLAYILQSVIGKWGAIIINIGLIVALTGALLGWTIITAELPYIASKDKVMPKFLSKENKHGAPSSSLYLTTIVTQILLLFSHFSNSGYQVLYTIASTAILIPYFLSALYALKLAITEKNKTLSFKDSLASIIAVIYTLWILYAAGTKYILLNCIFFSIGLIFFIWAKKENKRKVFHAWYEVLIAIIILLLSVLAIYLLLTNKISV